MASVLDIQRALIARGYDVGSPGADGVMGRATIAAIKQLQASKRLRVDGIVGRETRAALGLAEPPVGTAVAPPWFLELARKKGLRETDPELKKWLKSDGATLGDPAQLPWCGDAIETSIANTLPEEVLPANPYYALNWSKFGQPMKEPTLGAILTFKRPGGGHIGLYVGEDASAYHVLGGNQSNAVTICRIEKGRLDAFRWPKTAPLPTTGRIQRAAGDLSLSTNEA